jgi:hypothetical protein
MWVYIVMRTSALGNTIDKVYDTKDKALEYIKAQTQLFPVFKYWIEEDVIE